MSFLQNLTLLLIGAGLLYLIAVWYLSVTGEREQHRRMFQLEIAHLQGQMIIAGVTGDVEQARLANADFGSMRL